MKFTQLLRSIVMVSIITAGATLLCNIVLSKLMTTSDYGLYAYWNSMVAIFSNIIPFGTVAIVAVFRHSVSLELFRKRLSHGVLIIIPMVTVSFLLFVSLLAELRGEGVLSVVFLSIINVFLNSYFLIYTSLLRVEQSLNRYAGVMIGGTLIQIALQIVSWMVFEEVYSVFLATIFSNGCILMVVFKIFHNEKLICGFENNIFDIDQFKWSLKYGFPIVISSVAMSFLNVGDKILYKTNSEPEAFGEYSKFTLIAGMVMFMVNNFATAWGTFLSKNLSEMSISEVKNLYLKGCKYSISAGGLLLLILIPSIILTYVQIYNSPSIESIFVMALLVTSYVLYGMAKFHIGFLMYFRKNYFILWATLIACGIMFFGYHTFEIHTHTNVAVIVMISYASFYIILWLMNSFFLKSLAEKNFQ